MKKSTKIWLWAALILSCATTIMNASFGRWISVVIALAALTGLCVLLFGQKKWGYILMCTCYVGAFVNGVLQGFSGETSLMISIVMSFIGSALIPFVTGMFLLKDWKNLK